MTVLRWIVRHKVWSLLIVLVIFMVLSVSGHEVVSPEIAGIIFVVSLFVFWSLSHFKARKVQR